MNITKQALEMSVMIGVVTSMAPILHAQQNIVLTMPKGIMVDDRGGKAKQEDQGEPAVKQDGSKLQGLSFERSPANLLQTLKKGQQISDPEALQMAVVLGDWPKVGQMLKSVDPQVAMGVYLKILNALRSQSASVDDYYAQAAPDSRGGRSNGRDVSNKSLLLPEDLYAIITMAPGEFKQDHIDLLAELVKIAITSERKKEFLSKLDQGLQGVGGKSPSGKLLAAQLLSACGWIVEAGPYLPLDRASWEQSDTMSLVLLLEHYTQRGVDERDERLFKQAAEVCAQIMGNSRLDAKNSDLFRFASDRFVKLLPALGDQAAQELVRDHIANQPEIMKMMILAISEMGMKAQSGKDLAVRAQCLATQHVVMKVLDSKPGALPEEASMLVANWLAEAEVTYRSALVPSLDPEGTGDMQVIVSNYYNSRQKMGEVVVVSPELILKHTPPQGFIQRLSVGLQQRVKLTYLNVNLMNPTEPETLHLLAEYIKENPGKEKSLCEKYLSAWIRKRCMPTEDPNIAKMRQMGYNVSRTQQEEKSGIPLTRLRQNQNIKDYRGLIEKLKEMSKGSMDSGMIVQGFVAIHSGAEVFKQSDIEAIFGKADKMVTSEMMQLVATMRSKLLQQWQDPKMQQAQKTNRTEKEVKDEVSKGYHTCLDLLRYGMKEGDSDWKNQVVRGQVFFDASEFELARQIKLVDYVNLRDEAFASYRRGAEIYAQQAQGLARGQWTVEPYQMWFSAMLGASDLSHLTQMGARTDPGFHLIGDLMRKMPKEMSEWHLTQFGQMMQKSLVQVPGNLRQAYLQAGMQVLGSDSEYAQALTKKLSEYNELLDEAKLDLVLDGGMKVSVGQSFGVYVQLDHTAQLARESGGFGKYLTNGAASQNQSGGGQAPQMAYRDEFLKNIHAALDPTFEVSSVTFFDSSVKSYDLEREGWKTMPLAYLVLKAKDAAVDRIPSMQMDMDFSDVGGRVVLPVRTPVKQIDATGGKELLRPCSGLQLEYALDSREWDKDGQAVIEVVAHGNGLIGDLANLVDFDQSGMKVEVVDGGLIVRDVSSQDGQQVVNAERTWQLIYRRNSGAVGEARLKFPTLKQGVSVAGEKHQMYQDADLVAVDASAARSGVVLSKTKSGGAGGWVLAALAALGGLGVWGWLRRRTVTEEVVEDALQAPVKLSAISVLGYLRRLQAKHGESWTDEQIQQMQQDIAVIESSHYSGKDATVGESELSAIVSRWQRLNP